MLDFQLEYQQSAPTTFECRGVRYSAPRLMVQNSCKIPEIPPIITISSVGSEDADVFMKLFTGNTVRVPPDRIESFVAFVHELGIEQFYDRAARACQCVASEPDWESAEVSSAAQMVEQESSVYELSDVEQTLNAIKLDDEDDASLLAQQVSGAVFSRLKNFDLYVQLIGTIADEGFEAAGAAKFVYLLPKILFKLLRGRIHIGNVPENILRGLLLSYTQNYWDPLNTDENYVEFGPTTNIKLEDVLFAIAAIIYYGQFAPIEVLQRTLKIREKFKTFIPKFFQKLDDFVKDPINYFVQEGTDNPVMINEPLQIDPMIEILQQDDVDSLQKTSTQTRFDFNDTVEFKFWQYNVDNKKPEKITYLECAALFGSEECFKFLELNDAVFTKDIGTFAIIGGSSLIIRECENKEFSFIKSLSNAIQFHMNEYVDWIIMTNALFSFNDPNIITGIFDNCNFEMIYIIIQQYLTNDISYLFMNSLIFNIKPIYNYLFAMNSSIEKELDLNQTMYAAVFNNSIRAVNVVLELGKKSHITFKQIYSCFYKQPSFFEIPLSNLNGLTHNFGGQFVQFNAYDPIGLAAYCGNYEVFILLAETLGINYDIKYFDGKFYIYTNIVGTAILGGSTKILDYLFEHSDFEKDIKVISDYSCDTYLNIASRCGNLYAIRKILENGGDVNLENETYSHDFPLLLASEQGEIEAMKLLMSDSKIDINKTIKDINNYSISAIYRAVVCEKIDAIKLLLERDDIKLDGFIIDKNTIISEQIIQIFREYLSKHPNKKCSFI